MKSALVIFQTKGVRTLNARKTVGIHGLAISVKNNPNYVVKYFEPRSDSNDSGNFISTDLCEEAEVVFITGCSYKENIIASMMFYSDLGKKVRFIKDLFYTPDGEDDTCEEVLFKLFGEEVNVVLDQITTD